MNYILTASLVLNLVLLVLLVRSIRKTKHYKDLFQHLGGENKRLLGLVSDLRTIIKK